jgi:hypothetical protein
VRVLTHIKKLDDCFGQFAEFLQLSQAAVLAKGTNGEHAMSFVAPPVDLRGLAARSAGRRPRRWLFGTRKVVPNDDDEVTEQQDQRGTDIKQNELHKSPKSLSHLRQRSLVTGSRAHSHLARHVIYRFMETGNDYSGELQNRKCFGQFLGPRRVKAADMSGLTVSVRPAPVAQTSEMPGANRTFVGGR